MEQEINVTNSEWYLLECLWEESPQTLMQLSGGLKERKDWSKSTCATMVRRMAKKELIGFTEDGKTKRFYPLVKKEEITVRETKDFLQRIYNGSVSMMMHALVEQDGLTEEDIVQLQQILETAQKEKKD